MKQSLIKNTVTVAALSAALFMGGQSLAATKEDVTSQKATIEKISQKIETTTTTAKKLEAAIEKVKDENQALALQLSEENQKLANLKELGAEDVQPLSPLTVTPLTAVTTTNDSLNSLTLTVEKLAHDLEQKQDDEKELSKEKDKNEATQKELDEQKAAAQATLNELEEAVKEAQAEEQALKETTGGNSAPSIAANYLGTPYVWGGTTPSGFDCSGLVQYVFNQMGISVGRTTTDQESAGTSVSMDALQAGDLLFWGSPGASYHVAIYVGNGEYIHAPVPGDVVKYDTISGYTPSFAIRV
ncbi:hypothetical protein RU97_GL000833 [Enterococcus canis]|uniref:NlpC/P60 domain-containing protein n=1 Tax=Enterococcus canis TaxID=214095 RepID=A0A1L8RHU0_9ENTE|nr:C40 family peptidase [Enterococcus canis]OJG19262.1 hypothetical protein RU97_GL000833 [Enterococcus canis]